MKCLSHFSKSKLKKMHSILFLFLILIFSCHINNDKNNIKIEDIKNELGSKVLHVLGTHNTDTIKLNKYILFISDINKNTYDKNKPEEDKSLVPNDISIKNKGILKLPLLNNKFIQLRDTLSDSDNDDQAKYEYIGVIKSIDFYLVKAIFYETGEYILINHRNGNKISLWGYPILSSNKENIVSFSSSIDYDVMPNGLQMFDIKNNELKLEWQYETDKWAIEELYWIDNKFIYAKIFIPKYISSTKKDTTNYIKISWNKSNL